MLFIVVHDWKAYLYEVCYRGGGVAMYLGRDEIGIGNVGYDPLRPCYSVRFVKVFL